MSLDHQITAATAPLQEFASRSCSPVSMFVPRRRRTLCLLAAAEPVSGLALAALGRHMAAQQLFPDLVILAGSDKVQRTWSHLEEALDLSPPLWMEPRFNSASIDAQLDVLRHAPADAEQVLLIAPPSAIAPLVGLLAKGYQGARSRAPRATPTDFPRGALAVVTLALPRWDGLAPKIGAMKAMIRPEDIAPSPAIERACA